MRQKLKFLPHLFFILLFSTLFFSGCYTQFGKPHVDTEDEYYYEGETQQQAEDEYYEQQQYEQYDTTAVVNNYYVNNYYYDPIFDPFYDPWYAWYVSYRYPYYAYYYSGMYPGYWWDPYYHPYYPGWYVSFYSGYYYYDWWYYDQYWSGGGMYVVGREKKKRPFSRRSLGELQREVRRTQNEPTRAKRIPGTDAEAGKIVGNKDARRGYLEPERQSRPVTDANRVLAKPKNEAIPVSAGKSTRTDRERMTIVKPEGKIIIRRPVKGTIPSKSKVSKSTVRRPVNEARPANVTSKPPKSKSNEKIKRTSKPPKTVPSIQKRKKYSPPRSSNKELKNKYRPRIKPAPKKSFKSPTARKSYRPKSSSTYVKPHVSRPARTISRPAVNRSSSRGTVSRPSSRPSSSSSGSKSSGSKSKKK